MTGHVTLNTTEHHSEVLFITVLLSFTNIYLSSQGKKNHFCVRQDKVALNPKVKKQKLLLKIKFKLFLKSDPLGVKMRLDRGWTLFTLFCHTDSCYIHQC